MICEIIDIGPLTFVKNKIGVFLIWRFFFGKIVKIKKDLKSGQIEEQFEGMIV